MAATSPRFKRFYSFFKANPLLPQSLYETHSTLPRNNGAGDAARWLRYLFKGKIKKSKKSVILPTLSTAGSGAASKTPNKPIPESTTTTEKRIDTNNNGDKSKEAGGRGRKGSLFGGGIRHKLRKIYQLVSDYLTRRRIHVLEAELSSLKESIKQIGGDVKELKRGIEELKDEVERVNKKVDEMESKEKRWWWKIFWLF